jgi:membrane-bound inhibitor of C-type lysozyme
MNRSSPSSVLLVTVCGVLLTACGSMPSLPSLPNVWPFGEKSNERSRVPPGATVYQCDGSRTLYVRYLDGGKAAWVILPEREFRLNPVISASGARYSNGVATLETRGDDATLSDGPNVTHANCKTGKTDKVDKAG